MSKKVIATLLFGFLFIGKLFAQEPELNASLDRSVVNESVGTSSVTRTRAQSCGESVSYLSSFRSEAGHGFTGFTSVV